VATFNDDPDAYRDLILAMVISPGHGAEISPEEFLRRIHLDTKEGLTGKFLARSIHDRSAKAVGLSMIVSGTFGFSQEDLPLLHELACADWHRSHEDVVAALGRLGNAGSIASLLCNINRTADQTNAGEPTEHGIAVRPGRSYFSRRGCPRGCRARGSAHHMPPKSAVFSAFDVQVSGRDALSELFDEQCGSRGDVGRRRVSVRPSFRSVTVDAARSVRPGGDCPGARGGPGAE
jgi:hypothetical protein